MAATKTKVGAVQQKRSTHNLSAPHFTTTDLFKVQPVFCREVFKGDRFDIKMAQINRVDALPYSSFVEIDNKHDWFYVKCSQIWKPFEAFMSQSPYAFPLNGVGNYQNIVPSEVPYWTAAELFGFFGGGQVATVEGSTQYYGLSTHTWDVNGVSTAHIYTTLDLTEMTTIRNLLVNHECDFIYLGDYHDIDSSQPANTPVGICLKLNSLGRFIFGIMNSLGYRVPRIWISIESLLTSSQVTDLHQMLGHDNYGELHLLHESLLPLMAYMSIMVNYYVPTKWRDYKFVNSLSYLPNPLTHSATASNKRPNFTDSDKFKGFVVDNLLSLYYGSDYFTDSLVAPYAVQTPGASVITDPGIQTSGHTAVVNTNIVGANGTPAIEVMPGGGSTLAISEFILSALKAVATKSQIRALTKNNLIGAMLQQFGIKPESSDMKPYHLSSHNDQIIVHPLVAQSQTDYTDQNGQSQTMPLGFKAGEAQGNSVHDDNFDFDDYGFLICVNAISPDICMADGLNREMVHTTRDDFFDPAYVNLGYQPVANFELTINADNTEQFSRAIDGVFGFQNKYAEYGYPKYTMGGDFVINSVNNGLDAFHFNRKFDGVMPNLLQNSKLFAMAKRMNVLNASFNRFVSEYDRIFDVTDPNWDHIQQWTYFKVLAHRSIPANGEFIVGDDNKNVVEGSGITDNINQ